MGRTHLDKKNIISRRSRNDRKYYKTFNGKRYETDDHTVYKNKRAAKDAAAQQRSFGYFSRVDKHKAGFIVYSRKPKDLPYEGFTFKKNKGRK